MTIKLTIIQNSLRGLVNKKNKQKKEMSSFEHISLPSSGCTKKQVLCTKRRTKLIKSLVRSMAVR